MGNIEKNFFDRTWSRLGRAFREAAGTARVALTGAYRPELPDEDAQRLIKQIKLCLEQKGGEVSARARAADLGRIYLSLGADGRARFLGLLAGQFGVDRAAVEAAIERWRESAEGPNLARATVALRQALESPREALWRQFNAVPQGIKFLVDLRAELEKFMRQDASLAPLDGELRRLLAGWFDIGFLDLKEITWNSPAALLEKLIAYEAVHRIQSWDDLKNRLDSDRRCFAFFHPRMPDEPLIFVEVALVEGMAGSVQALLDHEQPPLKAEKADTAIFYSISNCQRGLAGVSFGNFLIKRVVDLLSLQLPQLKTYATLSPIPGFRDWLDEILSEQGDDALLADEAAALTEATGESSATAALRAILAREDWPDDVIRAEVLKAPLTRLCAHYLLEAKSGGRALDRVEHFHLSNGARVERLNWLGDRSLNGLRQSAGLMVNYLYKRDEIDDNHEAYTGEGRIAAQAALRRLRRTP